MEHIPNRNLIHQKQKMCNSPVTVTLLSSSRSWYSECDDKNIPLTDCELIVLCEKILWFLGWRFVKFFDNISLHSLCFFSTSKSSLSREGRRLCNFNTLSWSHYVVLVIMMNMAYPYQWSNLFPPHYYNRHISQLENLSCIYWGNNTTTFCR